MADKFDVLGNAKKLQERRALLTKGPAVLGALMTASFLKPRKAKAQAKPKPGAKAAPPPENSFTVVGVGEMMVTRSFSMRTEPEFTDILKLMRGSDLTYGHLEMNIGAADELKWTPRGTAGVASYMIADPQIAKDLKWAMDSAEAETKAVAYRFKHSD